MTMKDQRKQAIYLVIYLRLLVLEADENTIKHTLSKMWYHVDTYRIGCICDPNLN